ncbi:MAG: ABC transporter permease [Anaerolineales bacterium]|nr:MAG: ABC transporter permease [Anaerolineales bacterium]
MAWSPGSFVADSVERRGASMKTNRLTEGLRIVSAFALKDIRDAIQNRNVLAIGVGTLMLLLSTMALPLLMGLRTTMEVHVYDPGRSNLIRGLAIDKSLNVRRVKSEPDLREAIGGSFGELTGLIIEPALMEAHQSADPITIQGFYPHWMALEAVEDARQILETKLSQAAGFPVRVDLTRGALYPSFYALGQATMLSSGLVIVILSIGGMLTPHLMIEEKEKGTWAALMVTPASQGQIVTGKALAGIFYGLIASAVALVLFQRWILHWDLAILAVFLGSLFIVAVGLLLGVITENPSRLGMWMGVVVMVLMLPVFMNFFPTRTEPSWWQTILSWVPSVGFSDLIRASFVDMYPSSVLLRGIASMLGSAAILLSLVSWRVGKSEI